MPDTIESHALQILKRVFSQYIKNPAKETRSKELTKILHGWIRSELESALPDYEIVGLSESSSERWKVKGKYYEKNVATCVRKDGRDLGVINVKFARSNYRQNANNYFESLMGQSANFRSNNIVYGHLMILTQPIIYFNRDKEFKNYEDVTDTDVMKYATLSEDHGCLHAPDVQCMVLAKISRNEDNIEDTKLLGLCTREDLKEPLKSSDDCWNKLQGSLSLKKFFARFVCDVKKKHQNFSTQGSDTDSN